MNNTTERSLAVFESAAINGSCNDLIDVQYTMASWQNRNFGAVPLWQPTMGACEEVGELAHAILKNAQKIRGYEDETKLKEAVSDAVADILIYLSQVCTILRLDMLTVYRLTAEEVMRRDWIKDPVNGVCATQHKGK